MVDLKDTITEDTIKYLDNLGLSDEMKDKLITPVINKVHHKLIIEESAIYSKVFTDVFKKLNIEIPEEISNKIMKIYFDYIMGENNDGSNDATIDCLNSYLVNLGVWIACYRDTHLLIIIEDEQLRKGKVKGDNDDVSLAFLDDDKDFHEKVRKRLEFNGLWEEVFEGVCAELHAF